MRVWTNGTDTVIAEDVNDAWLVWEEHTGEQMEDYPDDEWVERTGTLSVWDDDSENDEYEVKDCADWAADGRGFLCSNEL